MRTVIGTMIIFKALLLCSLSQALGFCKRITVKEVFRPNVMISERQIPRTTNDYHLPPYQ